METETKPKRRGRPPGLTNRQAEVLEDLGNGMTFTQCREKRGLSKAHAAELVNYLRRHGLVIDPADNEVATAPVPDSPTALTWWTEDGGTWQVLGVTLPHAISGGKVRTDMAPDHVLIVVILPGGRATTWVVSNRRRVSYKQVASRLLDGFGQEFPPRTVRRAAVAVGQLVNQEVVLPAWFI